MELTNKCINCGKPATHWHHVVPRSLGGNDTTNKVPLCEQCHGIIHSVSFNNGIISHSELTKKGLEKARQAGKQIGLKKGTHTPPHNKEIIIQNIIHYSNNFKGSLSSKDTITACGISKNTYYKYQREIRDGVWDKYLMENE